MNFKNEINQKVEELEARLRELNSERKELLLELRSLRQHDDVLPAIVGTPLDLGTPNSPNEKIDLFLKLFRCREDVYPRYWESKKKKGYSPVCSNEWVQGICNKPKVKCSDCNNRSFVLFSGEVAKKHLQGMELIGSYSITKEGKCVFLVADFDKTTWKEDIVAYKKAAREIGVEIYLERSKSGNGGHAWIFFETFTPAYLARQLGTIILTLASAYRPKLSLGSYDRFFPNQDTVPKGGFGNLIALPLFKTTRDLGNSLFIDENFNPVEDQWKFLSDVRMLSCDDLDVLLLKNLPKENITDIDFEDEEILNAEKSIDVIFSKTKRDTFTDEINFKIGGQIKIDIEGLPSSLISALKRTATFANPEFFKLQKMRFSTWKTPRYIFCGEYENKQLIIPRGNLDSCIDLVEEMGGTVNIIDERPKFKRIKVKFVGKLRPDQIKAVKEISKHEFGVLVAPPGVGKTVMGCQLIAKRKLSTLVLVHRKPLMEQWIERIKEFLDIDPKEIGSYGGSRKKPKGKIDIAMLQTVSNLEDSVEFLSNYGQIIIDECHHIPALSFEAVLKKIPAKYCVGLTATPYRKDGHQAILHMQCGPIRHEMEEYGAKDLKKQVIIKETSLYIPHEFSGQIPIHEIWKQLINDEARNEMIVDDIIECIGDNSYPLIVSDRKEHIANLDKVISMKLDGNNEKEVKGLTLVGDMGVKARREVMKEIDDCVSNNKRFYILATGAFIGEGVDLPILDRLILAMPISFKGRLKQYTGRIHRPFDGKKEVRIYDYLDPNLGLTISMFKKRLRVYKEMDYEIKSSVGNKVNQLVYQRDLFSEFK